MAGFTNKGKANILAAVFRGATIPTNFYVALMKADDVPDADTNVFSDLTEIAAGNGYTTGGFQLTPNDTDFDTLTENDADNYGAVEIKNVAWTATGGPIPSAGDGARYAILTDDNGVVANREVWDWWDLATDQSVIEDDILLLEDLELRITE